MSTLWKFPGGIQPPANKSQSNATPIEFAGIPEFLIFPLVQRQADAIPVVSVGQRVLKGEPIARPGDESGAPIHASTSGEIVAIEHRPHAHRTETAARCIVLKSDGRDEWCERQPIAQPLARDRHELIARIREAGVIGAGGAGFPAAKKLLNPDGSIVRIDTLIINGAECEPYITADDRLMRERSAAIVQGIAVLQYLLAPTKTLIGIEDDKSEAIAAIRNAVARTDIEVIALPTLYPMGGEGQIIQVLTGKEIPSDGKPADIGVLCLNIGTVYAIERAVLHDEPMIARIVTIAGRACERNGNYETLIGTPLSHLLALADFQQERCTRLINGGALMGFTIDSVDVPIARTSHCFIAGTADEFPTQPAAHACIRCGFCSEVCPVQLLPQQLHVFARNEDRDQLQRHGLFDCIECGACDYVCPSNIPLVQGFRDAKQLLNIETYEDRQAQIARQRFAAHKHRIAREQQEHDLRREQRLQNRESGVETIATTATDSKKVAIQAAIARAKAKKSGAQRPAVAAALMQTEPLTERLRRRIAEIEAQMIAADETRRTRLQRSLDDLLEHLRDAEANPDAPSVREQIERALATARNIDGDRTP